MTSGVSRTSVAHVTSALAAYAPVSLPVSTWRRAAVLVPLRPIVGRSNVGAPWSDVTSRLSTTPDAAAELEVVLTRRASALTKHSGQVAFPGGGIDVSDPSPEAAALREANEELAIGTSHVELIGRLDDVLSVTGFHVVPVVGLVAPTAVFTPSAAEVARVFTVPLADLMDKGRWEIVPFMRGDRSIDLPHFYVDGEDIWGLTALMLMRLLELL